MQADEEGPVLLFSGETRRRSIGKTVSYRFICIVSLLTITWLILGDAYKAGLITLVFQSIQTFIYYLHERFWAYFRPVSR